MANGWVKSLQCRSNAVEDVYHPKPPPPRLHHRAGKAPPPLLPLGCGNNTSQALRDVVALFPKHPLSKKTPSMSSRALLATPPPSPPLKEKRPKQRRHHREQARHERPLKASKPRSCPSLAAAAREPPPSSSPFPTLTELPVGHSSRRVVEIIFNSSWSRKGTPFPGVIEMLFKVRSPPRTVSRFEEYREDVRSRAGPEDARCAANGNEMMRFHCAPEGPPTTSAGDPIYDAGIISSPTASGGSIRTFAGSGGAHESGFGSSSAVVPGRRKAMLVCRVIAGRVRSSSDAGEFESISVGKGELLVFDPRAVLPCFLIIYKV
ncbi:unnamed protein product [Spirodela intermedia]|uniref:Uncharacterized protein n=2 Tax=Spirodela intermedia TaxID=51605 RepID=A0A7I8K529_SPIIN|nr:unnamed protein product [Spirodela intermedia]